MIDVSQVSPRLNIISLADYTHHIKGGDESAVLSPVESSMPISSLVQGKSMTDPVSDSKASTTNFKFLSPGTSSEVRSQAQSSHFDC